MSDISLYVNDKSVILSKLSNILSLVKETNNIAIMTNARGYVESLRYAAQEAKLTQDIQNEVAETKLRIERRIGEHLASIDRQPGKRTDLETSLHDVTRLFENTLQEAEITKRDAHNWQIIAAMPEADFEAHIAEVIGEDKELTTAGIIRVAKYQPPHVSRNTGDNEWYTPPEYIEAVMAVMGYIDLDPASTPEANAIVGANMFYTAQDDGLHFPWQGHIFMNPPYASELIPLFAAKMKMHIRAGDVTEAIVLVNNATETGWFNDLITVASAVCFPKGRIKFWSPDRKSATPLQGQAIIYIGDNARRFSGAFAKFGWIAKL